MIKVYSKRGNTNYIEKKMVKALQEVIEKKMAEDSSFTFEPAKNSEDLKTLYNRYCIENVEFTEVKDNAPKSTNTSAEENASVVEETSSADNTGGAQQETFTDNDHEVINPLNRQNPNIRDYVLDNQFTAPGNETEGTTQQTTFDEPTNWGDAFEIPSSDNGGAKAQPTGNSGGGNSGAGLGNNQQKTQQPNGNGGGNKNVANPVNPAFNDMGNDRKRKSTKRWAKYIVEGVCMLAGKGLVWYATKDISEAKLAEYELNNEMDLTLLLSLDSGQQATVKQFFKVQRFSANALANFDAEEKKDLADILADVMLEKGIAPTPMQELLTLGAKMLGEKAIDVLTMTAQNNSILMQLRAMKQGEVVEHENTQEEHNNYEQAQKQSADSAQAEREAQVKETAKETTKENPVNYQQQSFNELDEELSKFDGGTINEGIIESALETKE